MLKAILSSFLFLLFFHASSQIISTNPVIPRWCEPITIIYDATQGNGALAGFVPIYAHTGVITEESGPGNWQHVIGNWGTVDPVVQMTPLGNNKHSLQIYIPDYYGVDTTQETVVELSFVFRNGNGSVVGRDSDGSDIFLPVYSCTNTNLIASILSPGEGSLIANLNDVIAVEAVASVSSTITLYDNDVQIAQTTGTSLMHNITVNSGGDHLVRMVADNGTQVVEDSFVYVVNPAMVVQDPPPGTKNGINYINDNTVRLQLWAPQKEFVYLIGDFNSFQLNSNYFMKRGTDEETWWIELTGLNPGEEYAFQYYVDGQIRIGDPYSTKVLDFWNDPFITNETYPDLKPFPSEASGIVSVFQTAQIPFNWQIQNFNPAAKTDLIIYELLMRDFLAAHDYDTLLDTLDYLARLGVNAIEFMPVNEFEGNNSWGYNPDYHMALDKYYGTPAQFKTFIDACHSRGIAVILDVVFNHAFSLSPLVQLYWNGSRPTAANPWLNQYPKHAFNVGFDFNHDSPATREWMDRVLNYWVEEYKVDGFRFDLSKGFTQTQTCNSTGGACNVGAWGNYDASRIFNLKRMADEIWSYDPNSYLILEHFGDNSEETELANYGFMLWGHANYQFSQASMGYNDSDFGWGVNYQFRGWNDPHLVSYMESHDEERMMYRNLQFGNSSGNYDITDLETALARQELAATFFFTVPGPKMIWEFGELGYDYSINHCTNGTVDNACRLDPKPIRWDYNMDEARKHLYNVWRYLIGMRKTFDVFRTTNYQLDVSGQNTKRMWLNHTNMNVTILGNFNVVSNNNLIPDFQHTGWWYEFFSGDSLNVSNTGTGLSFQPGEYRLYTDRRITPDDVVVGLIPSVAVSEYYLEIFPNPTSGPFNLSYGLPVSGDVEISLYNMFGQKLKVLWSGKSQKGNDMKSFDLSGSDLPAGYYLVKLALDGRSQTVKLLLF